jgi:hypothetical protein
MKGTRGGNERECEKKKKKVRTEKEIRNFQVCGKRSVGNAP